ncbi:MAG: hypothetical protein HOW73_06670 [Polyangiaceae bacterium]|nr:hypothetical protein [Polyangiaceae bacterium]
MPHAARVTDPIGHQSRLATNILGWAGFAVGVTLAVATNVVADAAAAMIGTTGIGLVVSAALVVFALSRTFNIISTSTDIGKRLGSWIDGREPVSRGGIVSGARTVFIGPDVRAAANACERTRVDCHSAYVSQGAERVFIEGHRASRKGDGTSCGGIILSGCATVDIGGRPIGDTGTNSAEWVYRVLVDTHRVFDVFSTYVPGGTAIKDILTWGGGLAAQTFGADTVKDVLSWFGLGDEVVGIVRAAR